MVPKKTRTLADGTAMILDYLPYAIKALRELHQNKEIECRVAGKQTVYHALQEAPDETTASTAAAMDKEIQRLQEELRSLKEREKKAQAELALLCATPLLSELRSEVLSLEEETGTLSASVAQAQGEDSVQVSAQEKAEVIRDWKFWQRQASVRGEICRDLWRKCSETLPEDMTREELWEHLGLEGPFLN
ncbi:hypothetical protein AOCH_005622 [Aspergillus ochraceoroseus]|uniref:Homologous-pairing protein 2 winged helix domain-containing protein n=1 Tax=Aspergillus ochraceoroseus TaxID=138278 RepID=A0A0F8UTI0_9EURO|nr:hypothetical protein AOCH_005622 [Aspergillus ochraceoroseus]